MDKFMARSSFKFIVLSCQNTRFYISLWHFVLRLQSNQNIKSFRSIEFLLLVLVFELMAMIQFFINASSSLTLQMTAIFHLHHLMIKYELTSSRKPENLNVPFIIIATVHDLSGNKLEMHVNARATQDNKISADPVNSFNTNASSVTIEPVVRHGNYLPKQNAVAQKPANFP